MTSTIKSTSSEEEKLKVSFESLRQEVELTKAPSSVRNYLAMLSRLETFTGDTHLSLEIVDAGYVARFSQWLLQSGMTPSSVRLYRKMLRAILKPHFPADRPGLWKETFADVDSATLQARPAITLRQLRRLMEADLSHLPQLDKIRSIFLYTVYGGGHDLVTIHNLAEEGALPVAVAQQQELLTHYKATHNVEMHDTILRLTTEQYARQLSILSEKTGIDTPLDEDSAADAYTLLAREANLPIGRIAATLSHPTPLTSLIDPEDTDLNQTAADTQLQTETLAAAADRLLDLRERWYAVRGHQSAEELRNLLTQRIEEPLPSAITVGTRHGASATNTNGRKPHSGTRPPLVDTLLFLRCRPVEALRIRRLLATDAYMYAAPGSKIPSIIPDREMRTFLLLADISRDTLTLHFPETKDSVEMHRPGEAATVTHGPFSGQVGIVKKIDPDTYEVEIEFRSLGGARVRARIPAPLLK